MDPAVPVREACADEREACADERGRDGSTEPVDDQPGSELLDVHGRPLRALRLSVTDRCNFRCRYCMPREHFRGHAFLPRDALLSFEELERVLRLGYGLGVRRVRLTGGEPLLRRELPKLVGQLARVAPDIDIALTTNGVLLPKFAPALRAAGLSGVTVSLDAHEERVFTRMTDSHDSVADVFRGIEAAVAAGVPRVKVNCVVQRGANEDQLEGLAARFRGSPVVLRFIEYMDVGETNGWDLKQVVAAQEILDRLQARWPLEPISREWASAPAMRYRYRDGAGEIGIIASVTRPFCGACSRLRVSAEGRLHTCLFGGPGFDLRSVLRSGRSDEQVQAELRSLWAQRRERYSAERAQGSQGGGPLLQLRRKRPEMSYLGG